MIAPIIEKLIKIQKTRTGSLPCKEDVRIGLELLKKEHYPEMPKEVREFLYRNVRADVLEEYCNRLQTGSEFLKWKENDT